VETRAKEKNGHGHKWGTIERENWWEVEKERGEENMIKVDSRHV
jgi:hypothetical protein